MKRTPAVSVVIPLYNKEKWVGRAVKSVLSQTFRDFELIIIDDGSTDKSVEIVNSFDDNRIRMIHQANKGVSAARNRGISEAKGRYIAFIDADDEWQDRHLKYLTKALERYPDAMVSANRIVVCRDGKNRDIFQEETVYQEYDYIDSLFKNSFSVHIGSIMTRRELFEKTGGFFEDMKMGEDVNILIRFSCAGKAVISNYIGMIYHIEDTLGAMLSDNGVRYLPRYLKGVKRNECSILTNLKLKKFIFTEYLKKAYQNRKYPLNMKELNSRDAGEEYGLGLWSVIPYLIVRYMPKMIYKMLGKVG